MKITTLLAAVLLSLTASAQITLEKSYQNIGTVSVHNIEDFGYKYMATITNGNRIELYNSDHTLWKTIHLSIPSNFTFSGALHPSSKLFNLDNKTEVVIIYLETGVNPPKYTMQIVDEYGMALQSFSDAYHMAIQKVDEKWKAIVFKYQQPGYSDVYSLPGQQLSVQKPGKPSAQTEIYPNPMNDAATLSYSLPAGSSSGQVNIYNSGGILMRTYQVTNQFADIIIQRGELPPGVYTYALVAAGLQPVSKPFVMQ